MLHINLRELSSGSKCPAILDSYYVVFILKQFDTPLLKFSVAPAAENFAITINWVNEAKKALLPLDLECNPDGLSQWLHRRTIPRNRAYVNAFLAKCGLSVNRQMDIISICKGLSLNDSYWVVEDGFEGTFDQYNLYDNKFSRILSLIAFTGYGSSTRTSLASCPEFTTNGMLPKCWRRDHGKIKLYKGGTFGASNTGNEPYSEYYASQVAKALGIDAIEYSICDWQKTLCSTCEIFTDKDTSFMPVGRLLPQANFNKVAEFYEQNPAFRKALGDMLLLDAIICNTDRHFGNFGFLINNKSNTIKAAAPLFDHGNSLFSLAPLDAFKNFDSLNEYAVAQAPRTYDNFIDTAKQFLDSKRRSRLHNLFQFKFKKHSKYNLPEKRLKLIEKFVQEQAKKF